MLRRFGQFSSIIFGIQRHIQKLERAEMESCGYKGSYAQYLVILTQYSEGLSASQLCEICDKDKAAVSRITTEMQEKGLIERDQSANHIYRVKLKLTEEGRRVATFVCDKVMTVVGEVGKEMTEAEREIFYGALDRIHARLQALSKDGIPQ